MRYELSDDEWIAIKPMLPNKPRGVPRVNDRRVLNGIFWVLRSGAPWRDLPSNFGPYTTCYNRFVRWRRAGVWAKLMSALADDHDAAVQMIDTSIVRVHQHGACITRNRRQSMGRSRGGLTSKIHALVDTNGLPVRLALTAGEVFARTAIQPYPPVALAGDDAETIVLDLVQPLAAGRQLRGLCRKARRDEPRRQVTLQHAPIVKDYSRASQPFYRVRLRRR
jgi:transposase